MQNHGKLRSHRLFWRLDADGRHLRNGAAPSLPEHYRRAIDGEPIGPPVAGSCGTAAFRRAPVFVEDIATDPSWGNYRELALAYELRACAEVNCIHLTQTSRTERDRIAASTDLSLND